MPHDERDGDVDRYFEELSIRMGALFHGEEGEPVGQIVGRYRVVREIGRGGSGTLFLAERSDGTFEELVALKLLRRGLDTDDVLARFRAERQILASLSHPSIARLQDGGATASGRPYLVMELVEGQPITEYCDERDLSVDKRLTLFEAVAGAVQYAGVRRKLCKWPWCRIPITRGRTPWRTNRSWTSRN